MRKRGMAAVLTLVMLFTGERTHAIIRRHDRDDERYLELGAKHTAVTRLGGGAATLIEPRWLITAAHVAANLSPFDRSVRFNEKSYAIEGVVRHPQWRPRARQTSVDIALVKLAEPVEGITPVGIYDQKDEQDKAVVFVGPGMYGDGITGPQRDDGKRRAATNTVASTIDNYLTFKFDAPPDATELEGISGPGDSGGPALVEVDGRTSIIGVSSANDDAGAAGPCRYQSTEYYARVSTVAEWIHTTMKSGLPPQPPVGEIVDLRTGKYPDSRAGRVAVAFFDAYARGTDEAMEAFERSFRADSALAERSVTERVASWRKLRGEWGALTARKCVEGGPNDLHVLVRAEGEGVWKTFQFILQPDEPQKLSGISIASPATGE